MVRSHPVQNRLPQNVGSIINNFSNLLKQLNGQWGTPCCSLPQPATDNGVREVDTIAWSHPPPSWAVPPERLVHSINLCSSATAGIRSCNLQHARQPPCLCGHSGPHRPIIRYLGIDSRRVQLHSKIIYSTYFQSVQQFPFKQGIVKFRVIRFTSAQLFLLFRSEYTLCTCSCTDGKKTSTIQYGYRK